MKPRKAKLPIDAVKFTDALPELLRKIAAFFRGLGVVSPNFDRPVDEQAVFFDPPPFGLVTIQNALSDMAEGSKIVYLGPVPPGVDLGLIQQVDPPGMLKGVAFDKAWVDDVGVNPFEDFFHPHPNCKCEPTMKPITFIPSDNFEKFLAGIDDPSAPDVMLDPFVNHDPETKVVTAYGFRCYGRALGRRVHRIAIDVRAADILAATSVRDGKWPYHAARERWEECRREATRQHAADLILPIVAEFKKSKQGEA